MNVDDETLKQLRGLDAASFTTLTEKQRARAETGKARILATPREGEAQPVPSTRSRRIRARTRSRLAWSIGLVAVTGAAVTALVFAATTYLGDPAPVVGTTPDATSEPSPSTPAPAHQPQLTEAEAVAGCVEAWRPDPSIQSPERYNATYVNDKAIANVVDGEWQITLVPTQRPQAEWNLYCNSTGEVVMIYTNGYEDWPTLEETQTTTIAETVLLAANQAPETVMETQDGGTLGLNEGRCWVVIQGDYQTLVQFPFGSTLTPDGLSVEVPGVGIVGVGDTIEGGGVGHAVPETPAVCGGPGQPMMFWQVVS
ncbi:hypothetical protein [Pseudoclavibacter sp. RFBA6]|uniref:hypothetical protein n=1 Tax=Pseudoclavibacter sp. RFBA6 TaxID=2080573 RepID=UPI000CE776C1|nr:hypothetical protein [Pseudoclavibacter sp. RFBA6]PPG40478.1 hypothetical protein C5C17_06605 [Pseudoclavibacter sp. RFBA6]